MSDVVTFWVLYDSLPMFTYELLNLTYEFAFEWVFYTASVVQLLGGRHQRIRCHV